MTKWFLLMFVVSAKRWVLSVRVVCQCIVPVRGEHELLWEKCFLLHHLFLLTLSSLSELVYKITEWLRLAETSGDQPLLLKAGSNGAGSLGMCPVGFWVSSRLESPGSLTNLLLCLVTINNTKVFLIISCISLCAHWLCPCKECCLAWPSFHLPSSYLYALIRCPLSLFEF